VRARVLRRRRDEAVTAPTPEDPTPQRTWTDEAREAAHRASARANGRDYPNAADVATCRAVLAALAPHVARQVADLTADRDALRDERRTYEVKLSQLHNEAAEVRAERDSAQARVDAVKMLCDSATDLGFQHVPVWRLLRALDGRP
jgi:chromosome segregation ATPase